MFTHFNIIWFPKRLKPLLEISLNKISTHITQLLAEIYLVVFVHAGLMLLNPVDLLIYLNYKWLTSGVLQSYSLKEISSRELKGKTWGKDWPLGTV